MSGGCDKKSHFILVYTSFRNRRGTIFNVARNDKTNMINCMTQSIIRWHQTHLCMWQMQKPVKWKIYSNQIKRVIYIFHYSFDEEYHRNLNYAYCFSQ